MNNYTQFKIDSLAQLPEDCDLAPFVGFTLEEAVLTFRDHFGVEAGYRLEVYTYTRPSNGRAVHHVVVPAGAVPHAGRVL